MTTSRISVTDNARLETFHHHHAPAIPRPLYIVKLQHNVMTTTSSLLSWLFSLLFLARIVAASGWLFPRSPPPLSTHSLTMFTILHTSTSSSSVDCLLDIRVLLPSPSVFLSTPLSPRWTHAFSFSINTSHFAYHAPPDVVSYRHQAVLHHCNDMTGSHLCVRPHHGHWFTPHSTHHPLSHQTLTLSFVLLPSALPCLHPSPPLRVDGFCLLADRELEGKLIRGDTDPLPLLQCNTSDCPSPTPRPSPPAHRIPSTRAVKHMLRQRARWRQRFIVWSIVLLTHIAALSCLIGQWTRKIESDHYRIAEDE